MERKKACGRGGKHGGLERGKAPWREGKPRETRRLRIRRRSPVFPVKHRRAGLDAAIAPGHSHLGDRSSLQRLGLGLRIHKACINCSAFTLPSTDSMVYGPTFWGRVEF